MAIDLDVTSKRSAPAPSRTEPGGPATSGLVPKPRRKPRRWVASTVTLAVLAVLILLPTALVLLAAFSEEVPRPGNISFDLTFENFVVFGDPAIRQGFINSVVIGVCATVLAVLIGALLAFVSARTNVPFAPFIFLVGLMPMFFPSYVGALAWSILGGPNAGLLNLGLAELGIAPFIDVYSLPGLIAVFAMYYSPYAFLMIHSSMSLMSPDLEDAARVHGSSSWNMLRRVSFPLATPAILGSGMLIFILVFENFPVAQVLGTPGGIDTLPTFIFRLLNTLPSEGNQSAAIAVVLVAVVLAVTWLQQRMLAKRSYTTVSGKGLKPAKINLGVARWPIFAAAFMFFVVSIIFPGAALLITALQSSAYVSTLSEMLQLQTFSLAGFESVLQSGDFWRITGNSLVVGIFAALLGTALSFVSSYIVYRTTYRFRGAIESINMMPLAIPAVVLGMGLLWTWLIMPVPLYGTLAVMVVAFIAVQAPQGFRGISASMLSTDRDLEDSAVMLGATRSQAVRKITVPLMKVGITSTFLMLLMLSMRELTVPLYLYTSNTRILSIEIYDQFENGGALQQAASLSVVYCAIIFILSAATQFVSRSKSRK